MVGDQVTTGADENVAITGGLRIRSYGSGTPALLFVHGFCGASEDWDHQLTRLSKTYRCVALDLPGHGESSFAAEPTMMAVAAAVNLAKNAIGSETVLVGHSLGCKIVREAYRQSDENVVGIVFVDGSLYVGPAAEVRANALRAVDSAGFAHFQSALADQMFKTSTDPALVARVRINAGRMDPAFGRALFLDSVRWDLEQAVLTIRNLCVPALVIQAMAFDAEFKWKSIVPGQVTPFMNVVQSLVPESSAAIILDSGHFPMFDAPDELNRLILNFVGVHCRSMAP